MLDFSVALVGLALALAACAADPSSGSDAPPVAAETPPADPPLVDTSWRLTSLRGADPVEGVRPVLVFTAEPAERDMFDRPYGDALAGWSLMTGESGVGFLHAPYRVDDDTLRVSRTGDFKTRLATEPEERQARALMAVLEGSPRLWREGRRLALLAGSDTLATFTADAPRPPGPLDDVEWEVVSLGGAPLLDGSRATLTFSSRPAGPGPIDGYDLMGGYGGCNSFGGGYRLEPAVGAGVYRLSHPASEGGVMTTQMSCGPALNDQESRFHAAIWTAVAARHQPEPSGRDRLALLDSAGTTLVTFERRPERSVDADALRRGCWQLVSTEHPHAPDPLPAVEVAFSDSTFRSVSGCHVHTGQYTLNGDAIGFPATGWDHDGCEEEATRAWDPLDWGEVEVSDDRLVLYDRNGRPSVFARPSR